MMLLKGIEKVASVELKTTNGGKEFSNITLENGLKLTSWSSTATTEAQTAQGLGVPMSFWGKVKPREYQGKYYSDFDIENAQAMTLEKIEADAKGEDGLPF